MTDDLIEKIKRYGFWPLPVEVFNIGHVVGIIGEPSGLKSMEDLKNADMVEWFAIMGRDIIAPTVHTVASGDIPAAGASNALGTIDDWMLATPGSLVMNLVGYRSDYWSQFSIFSPASQKKGHTSGDADPKFDGGMTPFDDPRLKIFSYDTQIIPGFELHSDGQIAPGMVDFRRVGIKYQLSKNQVDPGVGIQTGKFTAINLWDVVTH